MAGEHLILTDEAAEAEQDALLSSLTTIAYATPNKAKRAIVRQRTKKVPGAKSVILQRNLDRPSQFFFKPSPSFAAEIEQTKKAMRPKKLTPADKETIERTKVYAEELPPILEGNINSVREFFLNEIAPLTLAAQAGTLQAKDVAQRLLKTEIGNQPFAQFERMVDVASQIRMAKYVAKYLKLPATAWKDIIDVLIPKHQSQPREVVFMGQPHPTQPPAPEEQRPTRPSRLKTRRRGT